MKGSTIMRKVLSFTLLILLICSVFTTSCVNTGNKNPLAVTSDELVIYKNPLADYYLGSVIDLYKKLYPDVISL